VKTTLEIPDRILRCAKSKAAERGISFCQFVTEAVEEKLKGATAYSGRRPPSTRLFESTDIKLGEESQLFQDID
jgi:hypothetical protein